MCANILSALLNIAMRDNALDGFSVRGSDPICHLMFADDIIIITKAIVANCQKVLNIFGTYHSLTNQKINATKSEFFLPTWPPQAIINSIRQTLGFRHGSFPFRYLGIPLSPFKLRISHFKDIIDKTSSKLAGWKRNSLSQAG